MKSAMIGCAREFPRLVLSAGLAAALLVTVSAHAQNKSAEGKTDKKAYQRTVKMEMGSKPWGRTLEWFVDAFGIELKGPNQPTGTFNFIGPAGKEYTLAQVIDHLNDAMMAQRYPLIMIREQDRVTIVAADQAIEPSLIARISIDDLDIDKPVEQQRLGRTELAQVVFPLEGVTADEARKTIDGVLGPFKRVEAIAGGTRLLVTDQVGKLRKAKTHLDELTGGGSGGGEIEYISLGALDGAVALRTLMAYYNYTGTTRPPGAPTFELDQFRNALLVKGSAQQLKDIRRLVNKLNNPGGAASPTTDGPVTDPPSASLNAIRYIGIEVPMRGNPNQVIEALVQLWPDLRSNPIEVVTQSQLESRLNALRRNPPVAPVREKPQTPPPIDVKPGKPQAWDEPPPDSRAFRLLAYGQAEEPKGPKGVTTERIPAAGQDKPQLDKAQLVDPREQPRARPELPGRRDKPIIVAPLNNGKGIMIGSDDPEALMLVEELVRYLVQPGEGTISVIPLRHADATEAATTLNNLFNERQQRGAGFQFPNPFMMMQGGPMDMMRGGEGGRDMRGGGTASASGTVRIVADTRTNALLVKAPNLELAKIRQLVETVLDVPNADSDALARTYTITLKYYRAADAYNVIRDVYRDFVSRSGRDSGPGGMQGMFFAPFPFGGRRDGDNNSSNTRSTRSGSLSLGVDERSNSLILYCTEGVYQQVLGLVERLEESAMGNPRVVVVHRIKNVDPTVLQSAVQVFNSQSQRNNQTGRPSDGSSFGGQRFGGAGTPPWASGGTPPWAGGSSFGSPFGSGSPFGGRGMDQGSFNRGFGGQGDRSPGGFNFNRGSGGGDRFRGGGGQRPEDPSMGAGPPGEPRFFGDRVMDDPNAVKTSVRPVLFDPQTQTPGDVRQASQKPDQKPPAKPEEPVGPKGPVIVEVVPGTDQVILIGDKEDVEAMIKILDLLALGGVTSETVLRIFVLEHSDPGSVATNLSLLYQRVVVGPVGQRQAAQALQQSSIVILPLPRQNALLVGAPQSRMKDVEAIIKQLDQPLAPQVRVKTYRLQKANAARVAATIQQFYAQRFIGETQATTQVRVQAEEGTNTVLIQASPSDHEEIERLIEFMEENVAPLDVKVFQLKRADAAAMLQILQQLFFGGQGAGTITQAGGQQFGLPQPQFGQQFGGQQFGQQLGRGQVSEGPATNLHMTIDQRTNSLIIAGSRSDLQFADLIITRLDSTDIRERVNDVYKLKNTVATDVYNAINSFLRTEIQLFVGGGELTPFQQIEREVVVVPEAISNSLIISATPKYYDDIIKLVQKLDEEPPQVVIQVLMAEVRLDGTEEFGVEIGLQSPVLFQRSLIPGGVVVNNVSQVGVPGFNFNNTGALPNSNLADTAVVAGQGLSNFGLGRASAGQQVGGFVFSAASDSFNLLIRALKTQGKIDVLSRPQITVVDNQAAFIQVGQNVPYITGTNVDVTGGVTNIVNQRDIGVILSVQAKISPDGHVIMRVDPEVSSLSNSTVNLGNNTFAPIFNITRASTTVSAWDGQTVVIGGLITRSDTKQERKIPWFGDLPYLGAAFRFRTHIKGKGELLIMLTPRVVRGIADAERIKVEEAAKMSWALGDVSAIHGPLGVEHVLEDPTSARGAHGSHWANGADCGVQAHVPLWGEMFPKGEQPAPADAVQPQAAPTTPTSPRPLPFPKPPAGVQPMSRRQTQPNALPRQVPDAATLLPRDPNIPASWHPGQEQVAVAQAAQAAQAAQVAQVSQMQLGPPPPPPLTSQAQGQLKEEKPKEKRSWKKLFSRGS